MLKYRKLYVQVAVTHGVFSPCEYMNHKFVDGGLLDNVPADEVRKFGVEKVITVKFSTDLDSEPKSIYDVIFKSVDILFEGRNHEAVEQSDYVLDIKLPDARAFDTKKVDYCFEKGYITAITEINRIKEACKGY